MWNRTLPALLAAALAGCATTQPGTFNRDLHLPTPTPSPAGACPLFIVVGPKLIAPAPGSTGVPITTSQLVFGLSVRPQDTLSGNATLHGSDGSTITSGPLMRSADGTQTDAAVAGLLPHTTYVVAVGARVTSGGCPFLYSDNNAGAFTTQ